MNDGGQDYSKGGSSHAPDAVIDRDELAVQLSELARTVQQQDNPQDTLDQIVQAATTTVPGAQHAGISMIYGRREVRTVASTGEQVIRVDRAQYDGGRGPCLDALYEHKTVSVPDMAGESRWREFTDRARRHGVGSMLSFQLFVAGDNLGALNLYSDRSTAFHDESEHVGLLFATHAAIALATAQKVEHMATAVETRDVIGQAKGILMERHKLTGDQAFALLVRASQRTNTKLRDLADHLANTGELTPSRTERPQSRQ